MTKFKFTTQQPESQFFQDIMENGYHIFNLNNVKIPDYYPGILPDFPGARVEDLKIGDVITIVVFFKVASSENIGADGGEIDLEVKHIASETVTAVILTPLPKEFALSTGESIEIFQEEILYKTKSTEH